MVLLAIVDGSCVEPQRVDASPHEHAAPVVNDGTEQGATTSDGVELVFRPQSYVDLVNPPGCGFGMYVAHVLATRIAWSDAQPAPTVEQTVRLDVPCLAAVSPGQCIEVRISRHVALVAAADDWSQPLVVERGWVVPCLFAPGVREVQPWLGGAVPPPRSSH